MTCGYNWFKYTLSKTNLSCIIAELYFVDAIQALTHEQAGKPTQQDLNKRRNHWAAKYVSFDEYGYTHNKLSTVMLFFLYSFLCLENTVFHYSAVQQPAI